jgi:LPXTG-motif cell wall-anchored protein
MDAEGSWLPLVAGAAAAALLALGALLLLRRRRRSAEAAEPEFEQSEAAAAEREIAEPTPPITPPSPAAVASPPPRTAPPAQPAGDVVGIKVRPWIELEFRPARATTTDAEATVHFDLILHNSGTAPARDIRIEVRMFNAGPDQEREIESFYGEPIRDRTPPGLAGLPPRGEVQLSSAVALPKEHVREIEVQGRRLFIPTVAFNIVYDWGTGRIGQTSMAFVVGREAETPTAKMGAFRLDLGPRLYRTVGQRPTQLARAL